VATGRTNFDPDFDLPPRAPSNVPDEPIGDHQRLVANPCLAFLAWIAVFGLIREAVRRQNLALFMSGIVLLFVAFFFVQFHCLDCGATGWLLRSWAHACPAVIARSHGRLVRRIYGPGPKLQLVGWFVLVVAALAVGVAALESQ
jgi:hypothetical protein